MLISLKNVLDIAVLSQNCVLWLRTVTCNWSVLYSFPNSQVICVTGTGHSSACLILFYFLYCKSNVKWCLVEEKLIYLDPHCCQDFVDVQHANFPLQVWFVQLSSLLVLTIWCKSLWSSYFRLGMDMDIHGYIHVWISDLGYTSLWIYPWIFLHHIIWVVTSLILNVGYFRLPYNSWGCDMTKFAIIPILPWEQATAMLVAVVVVDLLYKLFLHCYAAIDRILTDTEIVQNRIVTTNH